MKRGKRLVGGTHRTLDIEAWVDLFARIKNIVWLPGTYINCDCYIKVISKLGIIL